MRRHFARAAYQPQAVADLNPVAAFVSQIGSPSLKRLTFSKVPKLKITRSTVWENRAVFEAWTKPDAFRAAHSRAGDNKPLYLDHPQFEGFEVRQTVGCDKAA